MKDDRKQHPERLSYELLDSINQSADTNDFLRLPHLLIEDCKADYASFRFANFNLVHFNQTRLVESEFFEVTWKKLLLEACDLTESNWLNTSLKGLDFSQNTFERLTFSPNQGHLPNKWLVQG